MTRATVIPWEILGPQAALASGLEFVLIDVGHELARIDSEIAAAEAELAAFLKDNARPLELVATSMANSAN